MSREKEEIRFHIMHSMKGGCGKSTCSLFKALQLVNGNVTEPAKVLLLDVDFRGSAWQPLLFRDDTVARSESCKEVLDKLGKMSASTFSGKGSRHTLAIPDKYQERDNLSQFVQDMDFPLENLVQRTFSYARQADPTAPSGETYVMNGFLDFILAGARSKDKIWFEHENHTGKLASGLYINRLENLLNFILRKNATVAPDNDKKKIHVGQYHDVVIDMPPGYDEYSDIILNLLRKLAAKVTKIKLHYYQVTTEDIGHMALARGNIKKICALETEVTDFDTVNVILNNPFSSGAQDPTKYIKRTELIISELKEVLESAGNVYRNEYNASFHEYSTITERQWFELDDDALKKQ